MCPSRESNPHTFFLARFHLGCTATSWLSSSVTREPPIRKGPPLYHRYPNIMLHSNGTTTDPAGPRDTPIKEMQPQAPKTTTTSPLNWSVWPAKKMPWRVLFVVVIMGLTVFWATSIHVVYGVIAAFVLLSTTTDIIFPTQYTLGTERLEMRNPFRRIRRSYSHFESAYATSGAVYLRYSSQSKLLRRTRSTWLRCPENQPEVEAFLEGHLPIINRGLS